MALKGYRWYRIGRNGGQAELKSLTSYGYNSELHIIAPANCGGEAECQAPYIPRIKDMNTTPPTLSCGCGYYGFWKMADALLRDAGFEDHLSRGDHALVSIWAWGRVQHHAWGFRAERIALDSVYVSGPLDVEIADVYQCNKRTWEEALEMLTENEALRLYNRGRWWDLKS